MEDAARLPSEEDISVKDAEDLEDSTALIPVDGLSGILEPVGAIESAEVGSCRSCAGNIVALDWPADDRVRIMNISQVGDGWLANGRRVSAQCEICGMVYEAISRSIPIECGSYECPRCGPGSVLKVEVLRLDYHDPYYDFTAALTCKKCSRRRRFRKALSAPWRRLKRVKLGPTGVELELSDKPD